MLKLKWIYQYISLNQEVTKILEQAFCLSF